ncbi:MAG: methyltransferase domain-containing protein [Thaumarchaeota archaeon]|nr:methyltransferase domain-containing protein [Nitrososphaerota archaeon]
MGAEEGYKKRNMEAWNELAPKYHRRWANRVDGPLQSTASLIRDVGIAEGDAVLDVACGTGFVTRMLVPAVGDSGLVVGADASASAIRIARRGNRKALFVNADAENLSFARRFDAVTCQYALFFFPDAPRALRGMRRSLKASGRMGIVVHGGRDRVPYYGAIFDAAAKHIPDYIPEGTPQLDRYSTSDKLGAEVRRAGFSEVSVRERTFQYSPGTFEDYWRGYLRYVAKPIREKIDALGRARRREFVEEVRRNAEPYADRDGGGGVITFPWQVLILTAMR